MNKPVKINFYNVMCNRFPPFSQACIYYFYYAFTMLMSTTYLLNKFLKYKKSTVNIAK